MNKKFFWNLLTFMMVAMLSVSFVSCGGDNDDQGNPTQQTGSIADPEGTTEIYLNSGTDPYYYSSKHTSIKLGGAGLSEYLLALDNSNNLAIWLHRHKTEQKMIVSVGKVNGLGNVTTVPSSGWSPQTVARQGYGYIVHFNPENDFNNEYKEEYIRLFVEECTFDSSGNIMGIYIKYQRNWNPNLK